MAEQSANRNNPRAITAVVVTYGDRWQYLAVLLRCLEGDSLVNDIVVIDNASHRDIATSCTNAGYNKVQITRMDRNIGSAGGYKAGIETAITLANAHIMLFDDDVVPKPGCLQILQNDFDKLSVEDNPATFALIPYRDCQHYKISKPSIFDKHNFNGLNVFTLVQRLFGIQKKCIIDKLTSDVISHQRGTAYACLYFHRSLIDAIGLPDQEFVLYYDDMEFTSRILKRGGKIWLDVDARCEDICQNYSMDVFSPPFFGYLRADNDAKIFYMMRNKTYLDRFVYKVISPYYFINVVTLLFGISVLGLLTSRIRRVKTIYRAVIAGYQGKMGMHPDFPLI